MRTKKEVEEMIASINRDIEDQKLFQKSAQNKEVSKSFDRIILELKQRVELLEWVILEDE
ncbi:hypothetical protein ACS125_18540 [Acinetobacter sp. PFS20]|uniref:hypothetical protein n=1 Tax=Acinetobacter sp. PFS20 TaxID=3458434 RepID=UPI003FD5E932